MSEIEFGTPLLRNVKRAQKYELKGVAFIQGCEPVGFTFECRHHGNCTLTMDALFQANQVYKFFRKLLTNYANELGLQKFGSDLYAEWNIADGQMLGVLDEIEKAMGGSWKTAFKTMFYVYE